MSSFKSIINKLQLSTSNVTKILRHEYNMRVLSDREAEQIMAEMTDIIEMLLANSSGLPENELQAKTDILQEKFSLLCDYGNSLIQKRQDNSMTQGEFHQLYQSIDREITFYRKLTVNDEIFLDKKQAIDKNINQLEQHYRDRIKAA